MRPGQWIKNVPIFAALIFSQNVTDYGMIGRTAGCFLLFCLLTGGVYILNDLIDLKEDRKHPLKRKRPLASGKIKVPAALAAGILLCILALAGMLMLDLWAGLVGLAYLFLQIVYSFYLKHVVILDVFSIAAGFILRVIIGAAVIKVPISTWLLICVILFSLFLALGKRRHELAVFPEAAAYRRVLDNYDIYLLDVMISIVTSATLVAYILYTMSDETVRKFQTANLKYTVPFVLYGIFRYLYLIHKRQEGGAPEKTLLNDCPLLINIVLYGIAVAIILY